MKIIFSDHALIKIKQRKIHRALIVETVRRPDFIKPSYNFREERYKKFDRNYLKIVTAVDNGELVIITVHWVAKLKQE